MYISTCRFPFSFSFSFLLSSHLGRAPLCPKRARWFQVASRLLLSEKKTDFGAQVASITRQHDRALFFLAQKILGKRRRRRKTFTKKKRRIRRDIAKDFGFDSFLTQIKSISNYFYFSLFIFFFSFSILLRAVRAYHD